MRYRLLMMMGLLFWILTVTAGLAQDNEHSSAVDPAATKLLQQMSDYLDTLTAFTLHSESSVDTLLGNGQKIQLNRSVDIFVKRPNRLRVDVDGDFLDQQIFFNGTTITLYERDKNYFGTIDAAGDIEPSFDAAEKAFGLIAPAADLIFKDPYGTLMQDVNSAVYIGKSNVQGKSCHHLAFRGEETDWQIWIEDSDTPFPHQFIITSKWVTGAPQFTAQFTRWESRAQIEDSLFNFVTHAGDQKIEFLPVGEHQD